MRAFLPFALLLITGCGSSTASITPSRVLSIDDFEAALVEAGFSIKERNSDLLFEMWGASAGGWITTNEEKGDPPNDPLEIRLVFEPKFSILEYDCSIKTGREALAKVVAEGISGKAVIHKHNLVINKDSRHPRWSEIVEVFKGL